MTWVDRMVEWMSRYWPKAAQAFATWMANHPWAC